MADGGKVGVRSERQENKGKLKKTKAAPAEDEEKRERERGCSLSAPQGMKQESVPETDRAQAERKTATTVDNFLILFC